MTGLYPLKFENILKEKIWGGSLLNLKYGKKDIGKPVGESWEISGIQEDTSIVSNGFLAGNTLQEIIEVYMGDITGDSVYEKFGDEFPLLIKLIEARQDLSIQVHPGDNLARERHNAYGKTEMWYILEAEENARIYTGFKKETSKEEYLLAVQAGTLADLLNAVPARKGDIFFTPAGRIHAIGAGITLAEIQQTSDITYRIYDWGRTGGGNEKRELHTELALDCIDFGATGDGKISAEPINDKTVNAVSCEYFVVNIIHFNNLIAKDYSLFDSFVIYMCLEGSFAVRWNEGTETVMKGETVLLPASLSEVVLEPRQEAKILEIFTNYTINN
jgi:mannose-6-phosphate isomerase